jgi:hypothetical protein
MVTIDGTDTAGTITLNTQEELDWSGLEGGEGIVLAEIVFADSITDAVPHVSLMPVGPASTGLELYVEKTDNGFIIGTKKLPKSGHQYTFDYLTISSIDKNQ